MPGRGGSKLAPQALRKSAEMILDMILGERLAPGGERYLPRERQAGEIS